MVDLVLSWSQNVPHIYGPQFYAHSIQQQLSQKAHFFKSMQSAQGKAEFKSYFYSVGQFWPVAGRA